NDFVEPPALIGADGFGIDHLISPERSVTTYLHRLIEFPGALQVVDFADGQVTMVLTQVGPNSQLINRTVESFAHHLPDVNGHVLAIFRNDRPIELRSEEHTSELQSRE